MNYNKFKKISIVILAFVAFLSFSVFVYSIALEPYRNQSAFELEYNKISDRHEINSRLKEHSSENFSREYWELRNSYLTEKYAIQELTLVILFLSLFSIYTIRKKEIKSPASKMNLFAWGALVSFLYVFRFGAGLFVDQTRGAFPHWADTIIIPFVAAPFIFLFILIIFLFHIILKFKSYVPEFNLKNLKIRDFKSYFGSLVILNIFIIIWTIVFAWSSEPAWKFLDILYLFVALYFNLSLIKNKNKLT